MDVFGDTFMKELQKEALKKIGKIVACAILLILSLFGVLKYCWM